MTKKRPVAIPKCGDCGTEPCICNQQEHEVQGNGAYREQTGTPKYHLVPRGPLARLANRYDHGAVKYGKNNWKKGLDSDSCMDHAIDHLAKHNDGDRTEDHLAAAAWNLFTMMWNEDNTPEEA